MLRSEVPLFSVVIPTFDRARVLPRAIEGVLAQTHHDLELIVVDDGSTDDTAAVVASYADERLRSHAQPNGGVARARNEGARRATGRYLVFLDSDDHPTPGWLAAFARLHADAPFTLAFSGNRYVDAAGSFLYDALPAPLGPVFGDVVGQFLPGGWAVDRAAYDEVGGYDERLGFSANTELILRLTRLCGAREVTPPVIDESLVIMEHRGSRPVDAWRLADAERFIEKYGADFGAHPAMWADYLAVWGVSAARLRNFGTARRYFRMAQALAPGRSHGARAALTFVPGARELVWKPSRRVPLTRSTGRSAAVAGKRRG